MLLSAVQQMIGASSMDLIGPLKPSLQAQKILGEQLVQGSSGELSLETRRTGVK